MSRADLLLSAARRNAGKAELMLMPKHWRQDGAYMPDAATLRQVQERLASAMEMVAQLISETDDGDGPRWDR